MGETIEGFEASKVRISTMSAQSKVAEMACAETMGNRCKAYGQR
jgi:hypothetical protein